MAVGTITVQAASLLGVKPTFNVASADGDKFANTGNVVAHFKNGAASPITVTVDSKVNCNQGFDHNVSVVIPAGEEKVIGPFPTQRFNDTDGTLTMTYSSHTDLTVAVVKTVI